MVCVCGVIIRCRVFFVGNADQYSRDSICTSITRIQHEVCKLDVISGGGGGHRRPAYSISKRSKRSLSENSRDIQWIQSGDAFKPIGEKPKNKSMMVDKLASLSPAQYVKLDKERQLRERQLKGCMHSLTTLFDNIVTRKFPETNLKEQIETAKEETVCSRVSDQVMKYLDSESVTESLINVLNDIVEDNENPLPLKGDLTALVYDIGNLKEKSSMILDTKCDLVPSSTSISSLTKTDISESNLL